jgi:Mn-dependent DtxR family transcriptional regulator
MTPYELEVIKNVKLKARFLGITQAEIAKELKVSIITVKRWFAGKGLKISNLKALCDLMGIKMVDVFAELDMDQTPQKYSLKQEAALAEDDKLLAFYDYLISGLTPVQVSKKFKIRESEVTKMLLKLDDIDLIELHPNNKIRHKMKGEPKWNTNGPLAQKYRHALLSHFIGNHENPTFFLHDYLPSDYKQIQRMIKDLEHLMISANTRAILQPARAKSYGFYLLLKEFEWDLRKCLEDEH